MAYIGRDLSTDIAAKTYRYVVGTPSGTYSGSTTVFPCVYDLGVKVYVQGIKIPENEITSTSGVDITIPGGVAIGAVIEIDAFDTWRAANHYDIGEVDGLISGLQTQIDTNETDLNTFISPVASSVLINPDSLAISNTLNTLGFDVLTYTGNGSTQNIATGIDSVDFTVASNGSGYWLDRSTNQVKNDAGTVIESGSADWGTNKGVSKVHIKSLTNAFGHYVFDGLRGVTKYLLTADTDTEAVSGDSLQAFTTTGVTLGPAGGINGNGEDLVLYQTLYTHIRWGLTEHSKLYIEAYNPITQENMIYYLGSGQNGHTIPISLGVELDYANIKQIDAVNGWVVNVNSIGAYGNLDTTGAINQTGANLLEFSTEGVVCKSGGASNGLDNEYIMYGKAKSDAWTIKEYSGTGTAGLFVPLGIRPARVIMKRVDSTGNWTVKDNNRGGDSTIYLNLGIAEEAVSRSIVFQDNGFNILDSNADINAAGGKYIVIAEADTNGNGGGSYFDCSTSTSNLSLTSAHFRHLVGKNKRGFTHSIEEVTGTIPLSGVSDGVKYIGKDLGANTYVYDNMEPEVGADGTITRSNYDENGLDEFDVVGYTGVTGTNTIKMPSIAGDVDFSWIKARNQAFSHHIVDSIRGLNKLQADTTGAEGVSNVTLGTGQVSIADNSIGEVNSSGDSYIAWCASLPTDSTDTNGTITSTVKANEFMSAISYTGTGANATVGHGLGKQAELLISKNRIDGTKSWGVWHKDLGDNGALLLDTAGAEITNSVYWNGGVQTSDTFSLGTWGNNNASGQGVITYAFTSIAGKCDIGSYVGTGISGNMIDCGFEPAWVMVKRVDSAEDWRVVDNVRGNNQGLRPNISNAEYSFAYVELTETGFTVTDTGASYNAAGGEYIYMAIAKSKVTKTVSPTPISYLHKPIEVQNETPVEIVDETLVENTLGATKFTEKTDLSGNRKVIELGTIYQNNTYTVDNPFGNENWESCDAEIYINRGGKWAIPGTGENAGTGTNGYGAKAHSTEDGIVIVTGAGAITLGSRQNQMLSSYDDGNSYSYAEARVIITYIGETK